MARPKSVESRFFRVPRCILNGNGIPGKFLKERGHGQVLRISSRASFFRVGLQEQCYLFCELPREVLFRVGPQEQLYLK